MEKSPLIYLSPSYTVFYSDILFNSLIINRSLVFTSVHGVMNVNT
ncbi:hypothetical protein SAMN05216464_108280 [Mucilaginibacter pineti]|uniref:Uncharacterized protein n=1 Tax=Mucilaginibacter pineti TaxID=1391627 RepID=A0A1G7F4Q0_9SPHI|nr:hypothetical protein SAMN05216464_108280 [Mucilaginibacter pineti]